MNAVSPRGALLAALACVLVSASFTANSLLGDYPYAGGQALRHGLAALLLLPLVAGDRRSGGPIAVLRGLHHRQWGRLALLAAVGMVGFNLPVLGAERYAEPAVPGVFVGCAPILVAAVVPLLDGRRPTRVVLGAAVFVAAGAFTVQGWGRTDTAGILWSAGETGFAVLAVPVLRPVGPLGPRLLAATVCGIAAAESLLFGLVTDGIGVVRAPPTGEAVALLRQAVVVTVVSFVCWYMGVQRIGAERATLFSGLIPVSAALTAPLVGTGSYGVPQAFGSALVGLGVALGSGVLPRRRTAPGTGTAPGATRAPRYPRRRSVVPQEVPLPGQPQRSGNGDRPAGPGPGFPAAGERTAGPRSG
ncbi:EamA family transporter [Streptomyces sp. NPDC001279]|uniref:EamA family transporter n=1 Tax=Streptomyces sp. NPDC001279 TaxID=3364556 RepID=UPI0036A53F08